MLNARSALSWTPPEGWLQITTIDAHTEGEPLRVVVAGYPEVKGADILARRRYAREHLDALRTALMGEPRGHADMYGCLLTPPVTAEADFGVLFLHNEGYSTMCGHGIIAVTKVALETGMLPMQTPVTRVGIDTPAGLVTATAHVQDGAVQRVTFRNVPSFVAELDAEVDVPGLGRVRYDLAYGGAFYAFVRAEAVGVRCVPEEVQTLIQVGMAIKRAVAASRAVEHPFDPDLGFLYGTIFVGPGEKADAHSRNVCIFAEGEVDRSPTGTGVSARAAIHHARGDLGVGESIVIESILGTRFTVRIAETTAFGPYDAVVPDVEGRAYLTGRHTFFLDPADPLRHGFFLR